MTDHEWNDEARSSEADRRFAGFDDGTRECSLVAAGHATTQEMVKEAFKGPWEAVLINEVDGHLIDLVTGDGIQELWGHNPWMLEQLTIQHRAGWPAYWSEQSQMLRVDLEGLSMMIPLADSDQGPCISLAEFLQD